MKTQIDLVDRSTSVAEALRTMKHIDTKALIVDKRDDDDEYGIVLISDIAREVLGKDRAPERVNVYEIMSKPVISVHPDMDIRYAARLFDKFGLSRAPVTKRGKIVGIVSYTDMVLKGLCRDLLD
ncbi:MAG: CBS domain-containing protein [Actinomycetales bacterium]|nr:CBS domain-containing protein [Actinomycetales bacterium]